jgi:hypothetical protein
VSYFDDIKIRRVIVTVAEIATVIEMVVRVNPFVDPDQQEAVTPDLGELFLSLDRQDLITVDRR